MKVVLSKDETHKEVAEISHDGETRIITTEDVTEILKRNEAIRNSGQRIKFGERGETSMHMIGSVSPLKMFQLIKAGIWYDDKKLRTWFKDLDNYLWSVTRGIK